MSRVPSSMNSPIYLFANGTGNSNAQKWPGGQGVFMSEHSGGTVSLEYNGPNPGTDTRIAVGTDTTLAASGGGVFYLPPGTLIRANGGAATAIYATVRQVN